MSNWSVREIRVRFRELLDTVIRNGPQIITRRGVSVAVLVSIKEWQRLQTRVTRINLKSVLLARKPTFVLKPRQTRVNLPQKKKDAPPVTVSQDEHPRRDSTMESLAKLKPLYEGGVVRQQYLPDNLAGRRYFEPSPRDRVPATDSPQADRLSVASGGRDS